MNTDYLIIPAITLLAAISMVVVADQNIIWNITKTRSTQEKPDSKPDTGGQTVSPARLAFVKTSQLQSSYNDSYTLILEQGPEDIHASGFIGMPVFGIDGIRIATVSDLILSRNHQVTAVVMASGGVFGIGEKRIALPIDELAIAQVSSGNKQRINAALARQDIINAPDVRAKGARFLTVISTTRLINRNDNGDDQVVYRYRYDLNSCPKVLPVMTGDSVYF